MDQKTHILSINLEDYFQVDPLSRVIPQSYWPRFDLRVEKNTIKTLDILDRHDVKATFFAVGWLADQRADIIAEVARRGHEIASKGYLHRGLNQMSREELQADAIRSREALERATGREILGYRIARGSLPIDDNWAFETLASQGFRYDSSIRPLGPKFMTNAKWRTIHQVACGSQTIWELPHASTTFLGLPVPISGGNYLRQMPQRLFDNRVSAWIGKSSDPWHFYFHIWELDPEQPRITAAPFLNRIRQYRNLDLMPERIENFLSRYRFQSIAHHLDLTAQPVTVKAKATTVKTTAQRKSTSAQPVTIVVPCYNEQQTLPYLERTLREFAEDNEGRLKLSYVLVDDGSVDNTWDVLNEIFGTRSDCQLIQHSQNRGIAAATLTGIKAAKTEIVCGIDCDCSFDPNLLADMIPKLKTGVDLVAASPYHKDGGVVNVPAWRLILSHNLSRLYRLVLNHKLASYTACFRVYRRSSVVDMKLDDDGFLGIAEILARIDRQGGKIVEFPAVLESRLLGVSKMKTIATIIAHLGLLRRLVLERGHLIPNKTSGEVAKPTSSPNANG